MIMKRWRVGSLSMGLILIASGVVMLVSLIVRVNVLNVILTFWPVILICLGIEILLHLFVKKDNETDGKLRYDALSVFFISFLLIISIGFYAVAYYANLFETREDMYASFGIMNETVTVKGSETLTGVNELVTLREVSNLTVLSSADNQLKIEYTAAANTNDRGYAEAILSDSIKIEQGERAYLMQDTTAFHNNRKVSWATINYVIYLPSDVTLDLSQFWGSLEYDNVLEGQILFER